ncbi:MAG: LytR/AlgR family response regulator transcription factor [Rhodothermaceae bacterium]
MSTAKKYKTRLTVKENHSHFFVNTDEIIFLEVNEKYLDVHTAKKSYLLRDTISSIEKELNPTVFRRVNRSTIVNMNFIKEIQPWSHGDYLIILHNSSKIKLSRKFTQNILEDK